MIYDIFYTSANSGQEHHLTIAEENFVFHIDIIHAKIADKWIEIPIKSNTSISVMPITEEYEYGDLS